MRQQFPDLSSDKLLKHPFLGLRVGALKVDEVCGSVNEVCSEEDQKSTEEVTKYIEKEYRMEQEDLCFGAQVHVALGVLTEEMKKIMGLLQARRKVGYHVICFLHPNTFTPYLVHALGMIREGIATNKTYHVCSRNTSCEALCVKNQQSFGC